MACYVGILEGEGHEIGCLALSKFLMWTSTLVAGICSAIGSSDLATAAPYKSDQIRVEYVLPTNQAHQAIYDRIKQVRALEHIQTLLSPLRLPRPLLLKVSGCNGESNAWYDYKDEYVNVCYEYLADLLKNAVAEVPAKRYLAGRRHTWTFRGRVLARGWACGFRST